MNDRVVLNQRQMIYWRLLERGLRAGGDRRGAGGHGPGPRRPTRACRRRSSIRPSAWTCCSIDIRSSFPHFDAVARCVQQPADELGRAMAPATPGTEEGDGPRIPDEDIDLRRAFAFSKLLLNVFGPNTRTASCTASQYNQWCQDVAALERSMGLAPGSLRQGAGGRPQSGTERARATGSAGRRRASTTISSARSWSPWRAI